MEYEVLYTHQKTKKAKTWHDGSLNQASIGQKAVLFDGKGIKLDSVHLKSGQVEIGEELESDRYLIQIESIKEVSSQEKRNLDSRPTQQRQNVAVTINASCQRPQFSRPSGLKRKNTGFIPPRQVKPKISQADQVTSLAQLNQNLQTAESPQEHDLPNKDMGIDNQYQDPINNFNSLFSTSVKVKRRDSQGAINALSLENSNLKHTGAPCNASDTPPSPWSVIGGKSKQNKSFSTPFSNENSQNSDEGLSTVLGSSQHVDNASIPNYSGSITESVTSDTDQSNKPIQVQKRSASEILALLNRKGVKFQTPINKSVLDIKSNINANDSSRNITLKNLERGKDKSFYINTECKNVYNTGKKYSKIQCTKLNQVKALTDNEKKTDNQEYASINREHVSRETVNVNNYTGDENKTDHQEPVSINQDHVNVSSKNINSKPLLMNENNSIITKSGSDARVSNENICEKLLETVNEPYSTDSVEDIDAADQTGCFDINFSPLSNVSISDDECSLARPTPSESLNETDVSLAKSTVSVKENHLGLSQSSTSPAGNRASLAKCNSSIKETDGSLAPSNTQGKEIECVDTCIHNTTSHIQESNSEKLEFSLKEDKVEIENEQNLTGSNISENRQKESDVSDPCTVVNDCNDEFNDMFNDTFEYRSIEKGSLTGSNKSPSKTESYGTDDKVNGKSSNEKNPGMMFDLDGLELSSPECVYACGMDTQNSIEKKMVLNELQHKERCSLLTDLDDKIQVDPDSNNFDQPAKVNNQNSKNSSTEDAFECDFQNNKSDCGSYSQAESLATIDTMGTYSQDSLPSFEQTNNLPNHNKVVISQIEKWNKKQFRDSSELSKVNNFDSYSSYDNENQRNIDERKLHEVVGRDPDNEVCELDVNITSNSHSYSGCDNEIQYYMYNDNMERKLGGGGENESTVNNSDAFEFEERIAKDSNVSDLVQNKDTSIKESYINISLPENQSDFAWLQNRDLVYGKRTCASELMDSLPRCSQTNTIQSSTPPLVEPLFQFQNVMKSDFEKEICEDPFGYQDQSHGIAYTGPVHQSLPHPSELMGRNAMKLKKCDESKEQTKDVISLVKSNEKLLNYTIKGSKTGSKVIRSGTSPSENTISHQIHQNQLGHEGSWRNVHVNHEAQAPDTPEIPPSVEDDDSLYYFNPREEFQKQFDNNSHFLVTPHAFLGNHAPAFASPTQQVPIHNVENSPNIMVENPDKQQFGQMEKSSNVSKYDEDFQINLQQWQPKSKGKLDDSKHFDALCHNSNTPIQNRVPIWMKESEEDFSFNESPFCRNSFNQDARQLPPEAAGFRGLKPPESDENKISMGLDCDSPESQVPECIQGEQGGNIKEQFVQVEKGHNVTKQQFVQDEQGFNNVKQQLRYGTCHQYQLGGNNEDSVHHTYEKQTRVNNLYPNNVNMFNRNEFVENDNPGFDDTQFRSNCSNTSNSDVVCKNSDNFTNSFRNQVGNHHLNSNLQYSKPNNDFKNRISCHENIENETSCSGNKVNLPPGPVTSPSITGSSRWDKFNNKTQTKKVNIRKPSHSENVSRVGIDHLVPLTPEKIAIELTSDVSNTPESECVGTGLLSQDIGFTEDEEFENEFVLDSIGKTYECNNSSTTITANPLSDRTIRSSDDLKTGGNNLVNSHCMNISKGFNPPRSVNGTRQLGEERGNTKSGFQVPQSTVIAHSYLGNSERNLCGDLHFPSNEQIEGCVALCRQIKIAVSFNSVSEYKQVLTAALKELLNVQLYDLAKKFHMLLAKVDVSSYVPSDADHYKTTQRAITTKKSSNPNCDHGQPSKMVQVKKEGTNKGRFFFACNCPRATQCKFFKWVDEMKNNNKDIQKTNRRNSGLALSDAESIGTYFNGQGVALYCECCFLRKVPDSYKPHLKKIPKWARNKGMDLQDDLKKKLYLHLSRKESSSQYTRDDLWVMTQHLSFDPSCTFLAKSVFFGPTANNEIEIEPISSFSPSNWIHQTMCHAIHVGNASNELICLENIQDYLNAATLPILPFLLSKNRNSAVMGPPKRIFYGHWNIVKEEANILINEHRLNDDQASAIIQVAEMFNSDSEGVLPAICLIHGVFGAGKSFLLAVIVKFMVKVFQMKDCYASSILEPSRLLISSTTNVAVDRILQGLLDIGFDEFVRIGSVKKIAKPVLPYSMHATGTDNQEMRDLQEMIKSDIAAEEKVHVRKRMEKLRKGENEKQLQKVRVVGATCAACPFKSLKGYQFSMVILDECSQITEPGSLLPIARFHCEKLVLVGDPKQLDPTIQGPEALHQDGLEQTLMDRLIKMGHEPIMLKTQYRCHPLISSIPNQLFYNGQLNDGVSEEDRPPLAPNWPTLCFYDVSNGREVIERGGSFANEAEAEFVVFLMEMLVLEGVNPRDIGVITLYRAQHGKISQYLHKSSNASELQCVQISTVDAFQGGERGVIILSCVRTDSTGFMDNDKRTNVGLTRSRNHLFIVGNKKNLLKNKLWSNVLSHCQGAPSGIENAPLFKENMSSHREMLENGIQEIKEKVKKPRRSKAMKTPVVGTSSQSQNVTGNTTPQDGDSPPGITNIVSDRKIGTELHHKMIEPVDVQNDNCKRMEYTSTENQYNQKHSERGTRSNLSGNNESKNELGIQQMVNYNDIQTNQQLSADDIDDEVLLNCIDDNVDFPSSCSFSNIDENINVELNAELVMSQEQSLNLISPLPINTTEKRKRKSHILDDELFNSDKENNTDEDDDLPTYL